MPNGKTHDRLTIVFLPIVVMVVYFFTKDLLTILIISISYLFSAFMFNGDLDTNSRVYNRWWLFKMIWIPYQLMFSHRSIFSHGIVIGTIIRILYIGSIPYFVLYYSYDINLVHIIGINNVILILIGLELGNISHSVPDSLI